MKDLLMFPGQGSQYSGMGKDWFENFKEAQLAFEEASDGSGLNLKKLCFEGAEYDLKQTEITQPAILTTTVAIFRSLAASSALGEKLGEVIFAGHSLGEYSALVCAGAISLGEAAKLVHHRGSYMQRAVPAGEGAMAALIYRPKTLGNWDKSISLCAAASKATGQKVSVANNNSPEQVVIAGEVDAVNEAMKLALTEPWLARKAVSLPVSAPFHCELMRPAADRLAPELYAAAWQKPASRRYIANVDAILHDLSAGVAERLVTQITSAVLWVQSIETALRAGCERAVEIGPAQVLSGLTKRIAIPDGIAEKSLHIHSVDRLEDYKNAGHLF